MTTVGTHILAAHGLTPVSFIMIPSSSGIIKEAYRRKTVAKEGWT